MNFDLTEEQEMFRASVERFAAPVDVEARAGLRSSPEGYDRARWQELAELGLIALAVPESKGGMGGSPVDLALVAEAVGQANAPDPLLENGILPALLLSPCGNWKHRSSIARDQSCQGDRIAAFAWAERSPPLQPRTRADPCLAHR